MQMVLKTVRERKRFHILCAFLAKGELYTYIHEQWDWRADFSNIGRIWIPDQVKNVAKR